VLKAEQVLNKLPDQVIRHLPGRGHWIYLAIINYFATFAQALATANKSGKTAAAELCGDFALRRKFSEKLSPEAGAGGCEAGLKSRSVDGRAGGDGSWAPMHPAGWAEPHAAPEAR